jgi:hypothetical protein
MMHELTNGCCGYLGRFRVTAPASEDRKLQPREWTGLTYEECKALSGHVRYFSTHTCRVHTVKITSVKTWKRDPAIQVHWKYGLYDYGYEMVYPDKPQEIFVKEAE